MNETAIIGQKTLHPNSEVNSTPQITYSEAMKKYIQYKRQRLIAARDLRDMPCQEHDDMPFLKWFDTMKKADDQYVAPRKNIQDTSINIGTIRDKDTTLLEYAQKYEFEPIAECYDEEADEMIEEMADTMEDMVRKSLKMEDMKEKSKLIVRSMIAFGTALVEERWWEQWTPEKVLNKSVKVGLAETKWAEKLVKTYEGCQSVLWDLRKCYFGDIRKFFMNGPQGQPYFFTVEYSHYDKVKETFGNWDNFKYVSTSIKMTPEVASAVNFSNIWTLKPVTLNSVEIVRYYDPVANEFSITLNGIEMLPIQETETTNTDGTPKTLISGFPLTAISPSGDIPYSKWDLEPMHDFAYSKPQPAKMRVLADIQNMMFKIMLRMFKQKADPTMGNKSGRTFDYSVSEPGTTINDIREGDLFPVLPNFRGPESSDFSMFELVASELSRNSVQDSFQGIDKSDQSKQTATQNLNDMKAQTLSVAALFDGIVFGMKQVFWLRTYNIIHNWTKPIDKQIDVQKQVIKNIYKTISVPVDSEGGQTTKKIIMTTDTPKGPKGKVSLEDSMQIHQDEMDYKKETGRDIKNVYLNPEMLKTMKLSWYYHCIPVVNDSDPLAYIMFAKQVDDAIRLFGPQSINVKKLKRKFAQKTGHDYDDFFLSEQDLQQQQQQTPQVGPDGKPVAPTPGDMAKGINPAANIAPAIM